MVRFPLEIENKKQRRPISPWVFNVLGLMVVVLTVVLTYIVLAAVTPD